MKRMIAILLVAALLAMGCLPALAEEVKGRALEDFSVQTIDGSAFTLSEAMADRDMVLINLWATWCPPCEAEFPYLEEAYEQYSDRVAVIALSVDANDTEEKIREYAESHGLTFPMGSESGLGLADYFGVTSIPTSVVVDRFGNVALVESGAQTSTVAFTALFDCFLDEGYTETEVLDSFPAPRPVAGASEAELSAAANVEGGALAFANDADENVWPMLPVEIDGRNALESSNVGIDGSVAAVHFDATATEGDALAFAFKTSMEEVYDEMFVMVDDEVVKHFAGVHDWTTWAIPLEAGEHHIALGCSKDKEKACGEDRGWIDDVRIVAGDEAAALLASLPEFPVSQARTAEVLNPDKREVVIDDPDQVVQQYFLTNRGWIVEGDTVTVRMTLTEDQDPETAFIDVYADDMYPMTEATRIGGEGYEFDIPFDPDTGWTSLYAYPGGTEEDAKHVLPILAAAGESGMEAFVKFMEGYGFNVSWHYADGE